MAYRGLFLFNMTDGYPEAYLRGFKDALLTSAQYHTLAQAESLEDVRLHLSQTDYGQFMANDPAPLDTRIFGQRCLETLVRDYRYLRSVAAGPLARFMDYLTYPYMIDNIVMLIAGTLRGRDARQLTEAAHPLGRFETMNAVVVSTSINDLYNAVLVDTPLAPYFLNESKQEKLELGRKKGLQEGDFSEKHVEYVRNRLHKAYLEDFYHYCMNEIGGETAKVMGPLLEFEADRRAISITVNSFGTELARHDREELYAEFGQLYPVATRELAKCDDEEQVRDRLRRYPEYAAIFAKLEANPQKTLDNLFFEAEVARLRAVFMQQMQYGVFYAWVKLKEQEIRNITWVTECVAMDARDAIANNLITIFD